MRRQRRHERGAVAVFVAISLLALFGFMALAMNVGHGRVIRGQLQNAADAGALAGARELNGTITPLTEHSPEFWAETLAERHWTDMDGRGQVAIDPQQDVELGWWDPFGTDPAMSFYPLNSPRFAARWPDATTVEAQARIVNAVHVTALRTQDRENEVEAWFGKLVGKETMDIGADAIATNGGPCGLCPTVPLAFFDCGMYVAEENGLQCWKSITFHYEMSPDQTDTVGFSSLSPESASVARYKQILNCAGQGDCCATLDIRTEVSDPVNVSNGKSLTPDVCNGFDQFCHRDASGNCHDAPTIRAPVVDGECHLPDDPPKFNQTHLVVGTATLRMTKLVCHASEKYMEFEFLCDQVDTDSSRYGCGYWGTGPADPRLVR